MIIMEVMEVILELLTESAGRMDYLDYFHKETGQFFCFLLFVLISEIDIYNRC